jgi:hypothetical protein
MRSTVSGATGTRRSVVDGVTSAPNHTKKIAHHLEFYEVGRSHRLRSTVQVAVCETPAI